MNDIETRTRTMCMYTYPQRIQAPSLGWAGVCFGEGAGGGVESLSLGLNLRQGCSGGGGWGLQLGDDLVVYRIAWVGRPLRALIVSISGGWVGVATLAVDRLLVARCFEIC